MSTTAERVDWRVRAATGDDAEAIAHIVSDGFLQTYRRADEPEYNARVEKYAKAMATGPRILSRAAFILSSMDDPDRDYFVVSEGESSEVEGTGYAERTEYYQELVLLYMRQSAQGKGGGQAMLNHLLDSEHGFFDLGRPILLGVEADNTRARELYKKFGFRVIQGSEHDFEGIEGMKELTMIREGGIS